MKVANLCWQRFNAFCSTPGEEKVGSVGRWQKGRKDAQVMNHKKEQRDEDAVAGSWGDVVRGNIHLWSTVFLLQYSWNRLKSFYLCVFFFFHNKNVSESVAMETQLTSSWHTVTLVSTGCLWRESQISAAEFSLFAFLHQRLASGQNKDPRPSASPN